MISEQAAVIIKQILYIQYKSSTFRDLRRTRKIILLHLITYDKRFGGYMEPPNLFSKTCAEFDPGESDCKDTIDIHFSLLHQLSALANSLHFCHF